MILDISFHDAPPVQYQHVRKTELRADHPTNRIELIVRFYDSLYPTMSIYLDRIRTMEITND